ncbi:hypothetical protein GpartN1_g3634.t1 [Galdieria partita]|uniref:SAP domain-containing protein n=1 Tax=Galdieria partita TaxID=83374 RepID=A0A9C7UQF5_9RHOD|nr:hypothetical protein GpartN1_g3634.t1 [Galdieria partita]
MELRRRTLRTETNNVTESTELAGSSHSGQTERLSSESSVAENSSLERLEREKSKSAEDIVATDSSTKGRSSLFRKFRTYLSSLVKRTKVEESEQKSPQREHSGSSEETGEERTPRRALFDDYWSQTSKRESDKPELQTSDYRKDDVEQWEEEDSLQGESRQTKIREQRSYEDYRTLSELDREESEKGPRLTRSRGMQTPTNSEHTEKNRERNFLLESAKSEAKGQRRKYTRGSTRRRPQEAAQKPVISKAKSIKRTSASIQDAAQVHDDQLSQAFSEDISETMSYQELRSLCKRLGIKATGKKTQLIGKLRSHVKSQETASEASVSHMERSSVGEGAQRNKGRKEPREVSVSSKLKRSRSEDDGPKAEVSGKTLERSMYSLETIALARAVLQHLESQQRTISVEEYELYQNILKNAVQKPLSQVPISEYPVGTVGSSRVKKRMRSPSSAPKQRKPTHSLSTMKAVEISIGEEVDSFSSQSIRQPTLKRQRIYSVNVYPFEQMEEPSPKSTLKVTPSPVRPTVSRHRESTGNNLTPVDVVRTFIGSRSIELEKNKTDSKPTISEQGIPIAGSAFTTPIVSTNRNIQQPSVFTSRKGTFSENRYFREQDTVRSQPLFSGNSEWIKTGDTSGFKRNLDTGKERIYDFRKNLSPTPSKASASDTAKKILETLERIAGNSAERKKPPPVTLDSLRKKHKTEENNRAATESKYAQKVNESLVETGGINAYESARHSNESVKESSTESDSKHIEGDPKYKREFSVNLAKDLFAKHIDAASRKQLTSEVEDKANVVEEPSDTIPNLSKTNSEEQVESRTVQQSPSQHFPIISSVTKRLMSDRSLENVASPSSIKVGDSKVDWKTREEWNEKDTNGETQGEGRKAEEHSRNLLQTSFEGTDHMKPNENDIVEHSENVTDNESFQKSSFPVVNEASSTHNDTSEVREKVEDSDTMNNRENVWNETNTFQDENVVKNRFESQTESGYDANSKEEPSALFTSHVTEEKSTSLMNSETKATGSQEVNEAISSQNSETVAATPSTFSYTSPFIGGNFSMSKKPNFVQSNVFLQSNSSFVQTSPVTSSAASFGSTFGGHLKANSSQLESGRSTLETASDASTGVSFTHSMPLTTSVMTCETVQSSMSQSYPSLFSSSSKTSLFLGAATSSNNSTSTFSSTTTLKDVPSATVKSPFSTSSFSGNFQAFSTTQSSLPSSNFFTPSQQSFPATSNQFLSPNPFTASSSSSNSFSSSGFQGFTATGSTDVFSKASAVNQETAQGPSLFSATVPTLASNAFTVPNPFSSSSPFATGNASSSFMFGAASGFSSSSFQFNASPFTSQSLLPQTSSGVAGNPFTTPFQFSASSNMPMFSSASSSMQFTGASSFALGSQNTSSTSGRKMVRARRLRQ